MTDEPQTEYQIDFKLLLPKVAETAVITIAIYELIRILK